MISQRAQNKFFSKIEFKCFGFLLTFFDLILKKLRILEGFKKNMKKDNFNICQDSNPHQAIFSKSIRFKQTRSIIKALKQATLIYNSESSNQTTLILNYLKNRKEHFVCVKIKSRARILRTLAQLEKPNLFRLGF